MQRVLVGAVGVAGTIMLLLGSAMAQPRYGPNTIQCTTVTPDQANKAAKLLFQGAKVLWFCPHCGDKSPSLWSRIETLSVTGSGDTQRHIQINGRAQAIDLAYLFYLSTDGAAHNVAQAVGCATRGVPASVVGPMTPLRRYRLDLSIEVMQTKANGARWEMDGTAPDPRVRGGLYRGGKQVQSLACGHQETFRLSCLNGTVVTVNAETTIVLVVEDKDPIDNDPIGGITTAFERFMLQPSRWVKPGSVTGQIKSAALALTPVK